MRALRQKAALARQYGLFRAASAWNVTTTLLLGIFVDESAMVNGGDESSYDLLEPVAKADFFVSHSWSCPSWMKVLAFCHYFNLDLAILSSFLACLLAVLLLLLHAGSFSGIAQQSQQVLFGCLIGWPTIAFIVPYLFGHLTVMKSFWFDQVCVDQAQKEVKAQILQTIPAFIAKSNEMLVLWDKTYFERLWCNYEIAVRARTSASTSAIQIVPMWMPLWTLVWFITSSIASLFETGVQSPKFDRESRFSLFLSIFNSCPVPLYVYFVTALPFGYFCIQKIGSHKKMLDQMRNFDLRDAKCAVESDRQVIEEQEVETKHTRVSAVWTAVQVLQLFDEALQQPRSFCCTTLESSPTTLLLEDSDDDPDETASKAIQAIRHVTSYPSQEEIIDQFNDYVRGPLCDSVMKVMGQEDFISLKLCLVVVFPVWLMGLAFVLGCDGRSDCETSAQYAGFTSVEQYMLTNAAVNLFLQPFISTLGLAAMLKMNHLGSTLKGSTGFQMLVGSILSGSVLKAGDLLVFAQHGILAVVVTQFSLLWLAGLLACLILDVGLLWLLFFRNPLRPTSLRSLAAG